MNIRAVALGGLLASGLAIAGPGLAQQKDAGWYIGGGLGRTNVNIDEAGLNAAATTAGAASAVTSSDENDTGWKLFGGYQFNKHLALELTYANLGRFNTTTTITGPAGTVSGKAKLENNWSGDLIGILPVGQGFSLFGRVGLLYSETKISAAATVPPVTVGLDTKDNDWNYKLGLGVGYEFTNNVGIRGEWERYRVSDGSGGKGDADLWSVSLRYKF